jgi:hypothetical protein
MTIDVDGYSATVAAADVADGKCWIERFPGAAGVGERAVREILRNVIDDQASRLPLTPVHARWVNDRLTLPPLDTLPAGYGDTAGTETSWSLVLRSIARSPRMSLVMGLALGGLYVTPLARQSYMVHVHGQSSRGKTTTIRAAGALFGNPMSVVKKWSVTAQGPGSWLRTLNVLTGFRDELSAAGFTPAQLEKTVFTLLEGAERDMSSRTGEHRESPGSWHGALISNGNVGVVGRIANEGIAARVIEFGPPLTIDAKHANELDKALLKTYGHTIYALVERGPTPEQFAEQVDKALVDLGEPDGGPVLRLAQHLATGIAGVRLLANLHGVDALTVGVVEAARDVLDEMSAGLVERGASPGARLLAAVAEDMASRPASWPTRKAYNEAVGGSFAPRDVAGWDLRTDDGVPGEVGCLRGKLKEIALAAEIDDFQIALNELRAMVPPRLHPYPRGRHLTYGIKVAGAKTNVYILSGLEADSGEPVDQPATVPAAVEPSGEPVDQPAAAEQLVLTPGADQPADQPAAGRPATPGDDGPTMGNGLTVAEEYAPCVWCGSPTLMRVEGQPRHRVRSVCEPVEQVVTRPARSAVVPAQLARTVSAETHFGEFLIENYPNSTRDDRKAAENLWSKHMRNIRFVSPGATARNILNGALKHASVPELPELDLSTLDEVFGHKNGPHWSGRTWVVPGIPAMAIGDILAEYDVNGMYLGAAEMDLGTGSPVYADTLPVGGLKSPGWVRLRTAPDELPYGLAGRIVAGMWVPTSIASWMVEQRWLPETERAEIVLDVDRVALWPKGQRRRWLRPHVGLMRDARSMLMAYPLAGQYGSPEEMALRAVKSVYTRMFGGMLRSIKHNTGETLNPGWSDLIAANGQARMFRALDQVPHPVAGIHVDAAWFVLPAAAGDGDPEGLVVSAQLGKWKQAHHPTVNGQAPNRAIITNDLIKAYGIQMWKPLSKALRGTPVSV